MKKVAVYLFLSISLLFVSCISTKTLEGPEGEIEYMGEVETPLEEVNAVEAVPDISETEIVMESVESVESIESIESIEPEEVVDSTETQVTPAFTEMTKEEKESLLEETPDAEDVNYVYKPGEQSDSAKIGNVDIPKWFAYLCFGMIIAILIAMCYIANQNKKKMYYYGRRD